MKHATPARPLLTRRQFLTTAAAVTTGLLLPKPSPVLAKSLRGEIREYRLLPGLSSAPLLGPANSRTAVWAFNDRVPGPEIRVRQGERLRAVVVNGLKEETTVHWHGVRVPNAQDGVPHLTQKPIAPGARYTYEFACVDAGTFWYHPHQRSFEQVGRGLYGALIVEEHEPLRVDRDITWVLSDWRLTRNGQISDDFGDARDMSHDGRIGDYVTVNGLPPGSFYMHAGERVRLRLINAANARIFALAFPDHQPHIIAFDGQPVAPHVPADGRILLGPSMRADLILDGTGEAGKSYTVNDTFYKGREYRLLDIVYHATPLREKLLEDTIVLPANPLTEPDPAIAERHEIRFEGGMRGNLVSAKLDGQSVDMREMLRAGKAWAINGVVATGHAHAPILTLRRNRSYRLGLINDTAWPHPVHLHGHSFRVVERNGQPTTHREWQDTVLLQAKERAEILLVADNPGDWMFHCHILEHQEGGMMAVIRVT